MASASITIGNYAADSTGRDKALLTACPDMRIVKYSFLAPALALIASTISYLWPLEIDRDLHLAGSILIATFGLAGIGFLLVLYEGLVKAVYSLTDQHIEEKYGIIYKRVRQIPLRYVRDVTHDQNFLQAMFGVSSITVSATNGDKIVLSNVRDGEQTREIVWALILSRSQPDVRQQ
jgi:membrane protein YdbS with pleckstrin-like domain